MVQPGARRKISAAFDDPIAEKIDEIAKKESRTPGEVLRLLAQTGLRSYARSNSLLCGFKGCTRRGCCSQGRPADVLSFVPRGVRSFPRFTASTEPAPIPAPRWSPDAVMESLVAIRQELVRCDASAEAIGNVDRMMGRLAQFYKIVSTERMDVLPLMDEVERLLG